MGMVMKTNSSRIYIMGNNVGSISPNLVCHIPQIFHPLLFFSSRDFISLMVVVFFDTRHGRRGPSVIQWTYAFAHSNSSLSSSHGVRRGLPGRHSHAAQWPGGPGNLHGRHRPHRQDASGRHRQNLRRDGHRHAAVHASGTRSFRDRPTRTSPTGRGRRRRTACASGLAGAYMKPPLALILSVILSAMALFAQKTIVEGRADSPVRAVIYEDLQCPDCAAFRLMMDEKLLPEYAGKVAFVHR